MTTTYLIVRQQVWGGSDPDTGEWADGVDYLPHGEPATDRAALVAAAEVELGHDDFNVLTIVDGRPAAFGHNMADFGPDEDGNPHGGYDLAEIGYRCLTPTPEF